MTRKQRVFVLLRPQEGRKAFDAFALASTQSPPMAHDWRTILEGSSHSPLLVGLLGAVVSLKFTPGATWKERVLNVAAGAITAAYLTPGISEWLRLDTDGVTDALAFIIGMLGVSAAAAVNELIRSPAFREALLGWLRRKDDKGGPKA